jgi:hypothetical protein
MEETIKLFLIALGCVLLFAGAVVLSCWLVPIAAPVMVRAWEAMPR